MFSAGGPFVGPFYRVTNLVKMIFDKRMNRNLLQIGINGPRGKRMKRSTSGSGGQSSRSQEAEGLEFWRRHHSPPLGSSRFHS